MPDRSALTYCLCLLLMLGTAPAAARQSATAQTFRLKPEPMPGVERGKVEVVRGEAGPDGHRFFLERMNVLTPVSVTLMSADPSDDVELLLTKYAWDRPLRSGRTGREGLVNFKFRTEGEFQATVRADAAGAPYQLVVWVGDELKPDLSPVVVAPGDHEDAGGARWWPWLAAIAIAAAAVAALVLIRRRRA